jgi:hypothetical protein
MRDVCSFSMYRVAESECEAPAVAVRSSSSSINSKRKAD